jgi:hypothetical protein
VTGAPDQDFAVGARVSVYKQADREIAHAEFLSLERSITREPPLRVAERDSLDTPGRNESFGHAVSWLATLDAHHQVVENAS